MILFEILGTEDNKVYQDLTISNGYRQHQFLQSIVQASVDLNRPFLSQSIIKALNFQAIACLHTNSGEYRPCPVKVGTHDPPAHYRVEALMEEFVNTVNRRWSELDPVYLSTYVLWAINWIHPFINGNGRTARATSYFVLCMKAGGWLDGEVILPELLVRNREEYVEAHRLVDASLKDGAPDLSPLHALVTRLLEEQVASIKPT